MQQKSVISKCDICKWYTENAWYQVIWQFTCNKLKFRVFSISARCGGQTPVEYHWARVTKVSGAARSSVQSNHFQKCWKLQFSFALQLDPDWSCRRAETFKWWWWWWCVCDDKYLIKSGERNLHMSSCGEQTEHEHWRFCKNILT